MLFCEQTSRFWILGGQQLASGGIWRVEWCAVLGRLKTRCVTITSWIICRGFNVRVGTPASKELQQSTHDITRSLYQKFGCMHEQVGSDLPDAVQSISMQPSNQIYVNLSGQLVINHDTQVSCRLCGHEFGWLDLDIDLLLYRRNGWNEKTWT